MSHPKSKTLITQILKDKIILIAEFIIDEVFSKKNTIMLRIANFPDLELRVNIGAHEDNTIFNCKPEDRITEIIQRVTESQPVISIRYSRIANG